MNTGKSSVEILKAVCDKVQTEVVDLIPIYSGECIKVENGADGAGATLYASITKPDGLYHSAAPMDSQIQEAMLRRVYPSTAVTLRLNGVDQTPNDGREMSNGQMQYIAQCLLSKPGITQLTFWTQSQYFTYESWCILLYLKHQNPTLKIEIREYIEVESKRKNSGVVLWQYVEILNQHEPVNFNALKIPTKEEHDQQIAAYPERIKAVEKHRAHSPKPPVHPLLIFSIAATAIGLVVAGVGMTAALANVEFAFQNLGGGVSAYQAMMLGGTILAFVSVSGILMFGRQEERIKSVRNTIYTAKAMGLEHIAGHRYAIIAMLYGPPLLGLMEGGIALLCAYITRLIEPAAEMGDVMGKSGVLFFVVALLSIVISITKDRITHEPYDYRFIAQAGVAGIAGTSMATMMPWLMDNTMLFADPVAISVSVFSAMAIIPVLGLLAGEAAAGIQSMRKERARIM